MEKRKEQPCQAIGFPAQSEHVWSVEGKVNSGSDKEAILKRKTLDSLLNVELVMDKSAEDIAQIWTEFFARRDTVYAVIPGEAFDLVWRRSRCCPSFLYALPRKDGYEFFVGQWTGTELHFTALTNIQTAGDSAQSQLILHHYRELQASKGIVLMMGECDSTFLNVEDARCLAGQVQLFYASDRFNLVQTFNHNPSDFKYMAVISALEQSS
ncbi:ATP synthase mitochondrial F1 complex assembly factor 1 isoform X2 [Phyllobates terribilis]